MAVDRELTKLVRGMVRAHVPELPRKRVEALADEMITLFANHHRGVFEFVAAMAADWVVEGDSGDNPGLARAAHALLNPGSL